MSKQFPWGKIIDRYSYDFDGQVMEVIAFHPWKKDISGQRRVEPNTSVTMFICEAIGQTSDTVLPLVIAWIAQKYLGLNQHALVAGVCRALGIE